MLLSPSRDLLGAYSFLAGYHPGHVVLMLSAGAMAGFYLCRQLAAGLARFATGLVAIEVKGFANLLDYIAYQYYLLAFGFAYAAHRLRQLFQIEEERVK